MTDCDIVLKHLKEKGSITSMEAISLYRVTRLAAVVYDLRHKKVADIISQPVEFIKHGKRRSYTRYFWRGDSVG